MAMSINIAHSWYDLGIILSASLIAYYNDVIMSVMTSQINSLTIVYSTVYSLTIVYSTVYSGAYQSKHQSSMSLAFVLGIHCTKDQ